MQSPSAHSGRSNRGALSALAVEQHERSEAGQIPAFVEDKCRLQSAVGEEQAAVKLRQPLPVFRSHRQSLSLLQVWGAPFSGFAVAATAAPSASRFFDSAALLLRLTWVGRGS